MGGVVGKMSRLTLVEEVDAKEEKGIADKYKVVTTDLITPKKSIISDTLLDPRSATIGIKRTPLILTNHEESKKELNETPVRAKPYLETDLDEAIEATECDVIETPPEFEANESEAVAGEPEETDDTKSPTVEIDDEFVQDVECVTDLDNSAPVDVNDSLIVECGSISLFNDVEESVINNEDSLIIKQIRDEDFDEIITFEGKIMNSPALNKIKKSTLVYEDNTPTSESTPVKPKNGRTPLGLVSNNSSPMPSPLGGGKPWRGFHEERIRLGLENTPPSSGGPFLDSVQSAPGKVGARRNKKLTRANWAQDESIVI